jgi:hypothetical protein
MITVRIWSGASVTNNPVPAQHGRAECSYPSVYTWATPIDKWFVAAGDDQ